MTYINLRCRSEPLVDDYWTIRSTQQCIKYLPHDLLFDIKDVLGNPSNHPTLLIFIDDFNSRYSLWKQPSQDIGEIANVCRSSSQSEPNWSHSTDTSIRKHGIGRVVLCNQSMFSFPVSLSPTVTQQFSMQITLAQVDRDAAIVTSSWDTTVRLWDAGTGEPVGIPLRGHTNPVNSISFSPDGTRIVAGFSLKGDE
jgi:WD40 repeat protein